MESQRKARYKFLAQLVGPYYSKDKSGGDQEDRKASPINMIYKGVSTLVPNLVGNDPVFEVGTEILPFRQYAENLALAATYKARKLRLRHMLRKCITDAIFLAGFMKTGIASTGQTLDLDGKVYQVGDVFADRIDPDDMLIDPVARDWEEQAFVGNRFRMPKLKVLDSGAYPNDKIEKLCTSRYDDGHFRKEAESLSGDSTQISAFVGDVQEYIDLVEIYCAEEKIIVTIPYGMWGGGEDSILRVVDYEGPERGPYHMLGFMPASNNVLPVPPASLWYQLHIMGNRIARKIARQAERMKRVLAYEGSAADDAQAIADADDGETVRVDSVEKIKEVDYGGTTEDAYDYLAWCKNEFSEMAGNIDLLSGVNAEEPTAHQSDLLQENTAVRIDDMKELVYHFTAEIGTDIGFFIHEDPLVEMALSKRVGASDIQVQYTPEMREGSFFHYMFKVRPNSMKRKDPAGQLRIIMEFITNGLPAIAAAYQALGPIFNLDGAIQMVVSKLGIEEADQLINSQFLQMRLQSEMMMLMQGGVGPDGKLMTGGAANPAAAGGGGLPGGARPGQPNPGAMGPSGGTTPEQERNQQYQEPSAQLQQAA